MLACLVTALLAAALLPLVGLAAPADAAARTAAAHPAAAPAPAAAIAPQADAPMRLTVDSSHPLLLMQLVMGYNLDGSPDFRDDINKGGWDIAQTWAGLPDDVKPYAAFVLHPGHNSFLTSATARKWVEDNLAEGRDLGIPELVLWGETPTKDSDSFTWLEHLYQTYPNFVGTDVSELTSVTSSIPALLKLANQYGGYHVQGSVEENNVLGGKLETQSYWDSVKPYAANFVLTPKNIHDSFDAVTGQAMGDWLSGVVGNWGPYFDGYAYYGCGVYGADKNGGGDRCSRSFPEVSWAETMLDQYMQGATVYQMENQADMPGVDDLYTPLFWQSVLPAFRYITTHPSPSKAQATAQIKAVFSEKNGSMAALPDNSGGTRPVFYEGLYEKIPDTNANAGLWFYPRSSGRYYIVPRIPKLAPASVLAQFPDVITSDTYRSSLMGLTERSAYFDNLYPPVSTGDAFVQKVGGQYLVYNTHYSDNYDEHASVPIAGSSFTQVDLPDLNPNTYAMMDTQGSNSLHIQLDNYVTDRTKDLLVPGGARNMAFIEGYQRYAYVPAPQDHDPRTTVVRIATSTRPAPTVSGYDGHYTYTENWDAGAHVYTLTVKHNGVVDITLTAGAAAATAATAEATASAAGAAASVPSQVWMLNDVDLQRFSYGNASTGQHAVQGEDHYTITGGEMKLLPYVKPWFGDLTAYNTAGTWGSTTFSVDLRSEKGVPVGALVRSDILAKTGYRVMLDPTGSDTTGGSGDLKLYRDNTVIASDTADNLNTATWYNITLSAIGSKITVSLNGRQVISATDSTYSTGVTGVRVESNVGGVGDYAYADNPTVTSGSSTVYHSDFANSAASSTWGDETALAYEADWPSRTSFDNPASWTVASGTWSVTNNDTLLTSGRDGVYSAQAPATGDARVSAGDTTWRNYLYSSLVNITASGRQRAGLTFRVTDDKNLYKLELDSTADTATLFKEVAGHWTTLAGPVPTPLNTGTWYSLAVRAAGSSLSATLNGKALLSATDATFAAGDVGYSVGTSGAAQFDDARVAQLPAAASNGGGSTTTPPPSGSGKLIAGYDPVVVSTLKDTKPALPSTVTARYTDGTHAQVSVTWASVAASAYATATTPFTDGSTRGKFTVSGTVPGTGLKPTAAVTVMPKLTAALNLSVTTPPTSVFYLPIGGTKVQYDAGGGRTWSRTVFVAWKTVPGVSSSAGQTLTVSGTILDDPFESATATVKVP